MSGVSLSQKSLHHGSHLPLSKFVRLMPKGLERQTLSRLTRQTFVALTRVERIGSFVKLWLAMQETRILPATIIATMSASKAFVAVDPI